MTRIMNLIYPAGGQKRKASYAQVTRPYSSPRCRNVRRIGPLEERVRGGSRPGIEKYLNNDFGTNITGIERLTYIDTSGNLQNDIIVIADGIMHIVQGSSISITTAYLTYSGDNLTSGGNKLIFKSTVSTTNPGGNSDAFQMVSHGGELYIADSTLRKYNPNNGTILTVGAAPTGQPLVVIYQGRIVLAGLDNTFYMSKHRDFTNWDHGDANHKDASRAIAGAVGGIGDRGNIANTIKCMKTWEDQILLFGCDDSLWSIEGMSVRRNVSHNVGIIAPEAAAITPNGEVLFLAREGIFIWQAGSKQEPEPLSPELIPEDLKDVDVTTNRILMEYDHKNKGVYLFKTPIGDDAGNDGEHWWIDMENKSLWPDTYVGTDHQPLAITSLPKAGYTDVIVGSKDGYLRTFDKTNVDDDGQNIESDILFGPIHVAQEFGMDGMIKELRATFADNTTALNWYIYTANTAEEVVDKAQTDLDAGVTTNKYTTGAWAENYNRPKYPRARGAWCVLWVSGTSKWSYEQITLVLEKLGRVR